MNITSVPTKENIVDCAVQMHDLKMQFKHAIDMTDDLGYAMDLAGIMFAGNAYGTMIQRWLETKYGWDPIPQTLNEGDFHGKKNPFVELKISILAMNADQANFLNLRLNSKVEWYLFIVRHTTKQVTKIFFAPKDAVQYMIDTFKEGRYDKHGTGHASIRVSIDSILWENEPDMNMWSCLHQYEITEQQLANLV